MSKNIKKEGITTNMKEIQKIHKRKPYKTIAIDFKLSS